MTDLDRLDLSVPPLPVDEIVRRGERRIAANRRGADVARADEITKLVNALTADRDHWKGMYEQQVRNLRGSSSRQQRNGSVEGSEGDGSRQCERIAKGV